MKALHFQASGLEPDGPTKFTFMFSPGSMRLPRWRILLARSKECAKWDQRSCMLGYSREI